MPEPPEAQSIRSMLHIVRILAIIFGILLLLGGIALAAVVALGASTCGSSGGGSYCGAAFGAALAGGIIILIFGVVDFVIYLQMGEIETMVNQRQYLAAKGKTLIWMVLGFILGGIIIGILLLVAYIKFDPLIAWQRNQGVGMPAYGMAPMAPPAAMAPPPPPPPPPGARYCSSCGSSNPPTAQFCAKCGAAMTH
jgi:hypothetical protein